MPRSDQRLLVWAPLRQPRMRWGVTHVLIGILCACLVSSLSNCSLPPESFIQLMSIRAELTNPASSRVHHHVVVSVHVIECAMSLARDHRYLRRLPVRAPQVESSLSSQI